MSFVDGDAGVRVLPDMCAVSTHPLDMAVPAPPPLPMVLLPPAAAAAEGCLGAEGRICERGLDSNCAY